MPFKLYTYRRINDLENKLKGLTAKDGRIFLVAEKSDKNTLHELLRVVNYKFKVWRWEDLYRNFVRRRKSKENKKSEKNKPNVLLDPPDYWLVLKGITRAREKSGKYMPQAASHKGFLELLGTQIRELIREEVDPDVLKKIFVEKDTAGAALAELYEDYKKTLRASGLTDSAGVTTDTRKELEGGAKQRELCEDLDIVLPGFSSFTHSQLGLVRALARAGAAVKVFSPIGGTREEYGACEQFCDEKQKPEELSSHAPFKAVRLCGKDSRGEFELAARSLVLWEQGEGELAKIAQFPGWESIAMAVPSSMLVQAKQAFSRYGVPCNWNLSVKVSDTPLMAMSNACLNAAYDGWQTEPTLRLLAMPWLCGSSLPIEKLRKVRPRGEAKWKKALEEEGETFLKCFNNCVDYAEAVYKKGGTGKDLLAALDKFASGRDREAAKTIALHPELDFAVSDFASALTELRTRILNIQEVVRDLGDFGRQTLKGADARAFLDAWAKGTAIQESWNRTGCMNVFADTPPTLFHAPYFFMFGTEAVSWPGSLKEAPLLDEDHKQMLHENSKLALQPCHLPLLSDKRAMREFLFRRLIACGDECTFICRSETDEEERPLEETTFIEHAESDKWIKLYPVTISSSGLLLDLKETGIKKVEARRPRPFERSYLPEERLLPSGATFPGFKDKALKVSLSSVGDYENCPYMFALKDIFKYKLPRDDSEYDPLRGGTAMHELWNRVFTERKDESIRALVEKYFAEEIGKEYPGLLYDSALRRIKSKLYFQACRISDVMDDICFHMKDKVKETHCEYALPEIKRGLVTFSGRCDRLDVLDDGSFFLWDYKAGGSKTYSSSLQLACYALALQETGKRCAGWGYICLGDGKIASISEVPLWQKKGRGSKRSVETEVKEASGLLDKVAESVKEGVFLPFYDDERVCSRCDFQSLCRRGEMNSDIPLKEGGDDE